MCTYNKNNNHASKVKTTLPTRTGNTFDHNDFQLIIILLAAKTGSEPK